MTHTHTHTHAQPLITTANTSTHNRTPQSTFKTLTRRIAARQPSIRSKPQRMKRDLQKMLQIGETSRPCTRASECTPKHGLPSPQTTARPRLLKNNNTNTRTRIQQPPITTATQAPSTASLNQRSKHSLGALQHVSLQSDQSLNARNVTSRRCFM